MTSEHRRGPSTGIHTFLVFSCYHDVLDSPQEHVHSTWCQPERTIPNLCPPLAQVSSVHTLEASILQVLRGVAIPKDPQAGAATVCIRLLLSRPYDDATVVLPAKPAGMKITPTSFFLLKRKSPQLRAVQQQGGGCSRRCMSCPCAAKARSPSSPFELSFCRENKLPHIHFSGRNC